MKAPVSLDLKGQPEVGICPAWPHRSDGIDCPIRHYCTPTRQKYRPELVATEAAAASRSTSISPIPSRAVFTLMIGNQIEIGSRDVPPERVHEVFFQIPFRLVAFDSKCLGPDAVRTQQLRKPQLRQRLAANPLSLTMTQSKVVYSNFTGAACVQLDPAKGDGLTSAGFRFRILSDPQLAWQITASSNLTTWQSLGTVTNLWTEVQRTDPDPLNLAIRFYQVLRAN